MTHAAGTDVATAGGLFKKSWCTSPDNVAREMHAHLDRLKQAGSRRSKNESSAALANAFAVDVAEPFSSRLRDRSSDDCAERDPRAT
jgi:hypothetical protein